MAENNLQASNIRGTGPDGRITKEDVKAFIKKAMKSGGGGPSNFEVLDPPNVDFNLIIQTSIIHANDTNKKER